MGKTSGLHILHIEDDEVDAELIRQTLLRSGLLLAYATDGTLRISSLMDALPELSRVARASLEKTKWT